MARGGRYATKCNVLRVIKTVSPPHINSRAGDGHARCGELQLFRLPLRQAGATDSLPTLDFPTIACLCPSLNSSLIKTADKGEGCCCSHLNKHSAVSKDGKPVLRPRVRQPATCHIIRASNPLAGVAGVAVATLCLNGLLRSPQWRDLISGRVSLMRAGTKHHANFTRKVVRRGGTTEERTNANGRCGGGRRAKKDDLAASSSIRHTFNGRRRKGGRDEGRR